MKKLRIALAVVVVTGCAAGAWGPNGRAFERAYSRGDWVAAVEAAERWAEREPGDPRVA